MVERELELAESGIFRVPEKKDVKIAEEHKIIENLLQLLGYGGKKVYVPSLRGEEKEFVEQIIVSDYRKGVKVSSRGYRYLLKSKLEKAGVAVENGRLSRILREALKEIKCEV